MYRRRELAKLKRTEVSITVSRTVQVQQFQPSTVSVTETAEIPEEMTASDVKRALYKSASKAVEEFIESERLKYQKEKK